MRKKGQTITAILLVAALLVSTCSAATYTVKKGDSLWKLAAKFFGCGQEYTKIVEANPEIKDPNLIYVDQVLTIPEEGVSADEAIKSVTTEGFVDTDGAKVSKIIVEYVVDMTGADVSLDDYITDNYGVSQGDAACEVGSNPGNPTDVSVDGKKVVIELNTDYQLGSVAKTYQLAMYAGVKQVNDITLADGTVIKASEKEVINYTATEVKGFKGTSIYNYANEGTYVIKGIEGYQIFSKEAGTAFHAENCFEEATGEYIDVDLPYALYVPEDYDVSKQYAVVLHIHDAGFLGDDPMITLTEAQGPYNFASDEVQQILKDQDLGGLIVVAPQINNDLRSTRDNWTTSAAVPATWQLMDTITETYNVDMNHIYATGQSMGAMQVLEMAAERDNYFAGILPIGCQWGTNYNKEADYQGAGYFTAPADGEIIWTVDADGNPCDYRNWFYMISDDNILLLNCVGDTFSTGVWNELKWLYSDLADAQFPKLTWNPLELNKEEQNAKLQELLAMESDLGFYWGAFEGGNHMATWIYGHGVTDAYNWLFTQTRESELAREKLALDKPFELADKQIKTEERLLKDDVYFLTGKLGAGTADYNTTTYGKGGKLETYPNWKTISILQSNLTIDGEAISISGYVIGNDHYYRLRDIASLLSETPSEFSVIYNESKNTLALETGGEYIAAGTELTAIDGLPTSCSLNSRKITVDGLDVNLSVYNIDGEDYFKLDQLAAAVDFDVEEDKNTGTIVINSTQPESLVLRLSDAIDVGVYKWIKSDDGSYYYLMNVLYCTNPATDAIYTDKDSKVQGLYESMNIYVPAQYFEEGGELNGYTAETAPVVLLNECSGWKSSTPMNPASGYLWRSSGPVYLKEGCVFVSCGARSRGVGVDSETGEDMGKAPIAVVDLKAGVRFLRKNADVISGDFDKIFSLGTSGGGQMSSILGASGDMEEYYPYLYEIGAAGIDFVDGKYVSTISDAIFGAQAYCPIADLGNSDLAYAWMRYNTSVNGDYKFSEFQLTLEDDMAVAYAEYINSLGLKNEEGEPLTFDVVDGVVDPRSGSYYEQTLENMSDALAQFIAANSWPYTHTVGKGPTAVSTVYATPEEYLASFGDTSGWLQKNEDGSYTITDLDTFLVGTNLIRNKDIPGFDVFDLSAENDAFGTNTQGAVHFSASVAKLLQDNYDRYSELDGFVDYDIDAYIEQALTGADSDYIANQVYLMNATQILLEGNSTPAQYWRTRNGTADPDTSFSVAYNLCMAALSHEQVKEVNYSLVWSMGHGGQEGTTTGTFAAWINEICMVP